MVYVYILYSESTKRYYTGVSADPGRRLEEHNTGKNRSTALGAPWQKVWQQGYASRAEAMEEERRIKKRGARRYLEGLGLNGDGQDDG